MQSEQVTGDLIQAPLANVKPNRYPWMSSVVTTVISIAVAVGLTWYQINRAEQEEQKAEIERVKTVKATLVSIVEDHVVNNQSINIPRLSRLVDIKSREANIQIAPRLLEIIQLAELNIINSGYLDFQTKDGYKKVFDSIYESLGKEYKVDYSDSKNSALIEQLISSIKVGNHDDSITNLQLLLEAHSKDVKALEASSRTNDDLSLIFNMINEEPFMFLGLITVYLCILIFSLPSFREYMRISRRGRQSPKKSIKADAESSTS